MTYDEFKCAVVKEVKCQVEKEVKVDTHKVPKNNGIRLDAITVRKKDMHIAPTFYLADFYQYISMGESIEAIAAKIIELSYAAAVNKEVPEDFFMTFESVKEHICYKLVNYEKNKEALQGIPHKKFLDLAIVFYYILEEDFLDHATVLIRGSDLERWGIQEEELYKKAIENTPKLLPWRFASIDYVVNSLLFEGPQEAVSIIEQGFELSGAREREEQMYVLTNQKRYYGAACVLYPGLLAEIAQKYESDLYILPSSIHECIIMIPSIWHSKEELSYMVSDINEREVEKEEVLADHVYFYDRELDEIQY